MRSHRLLFYVCGAPIAAAAALSVFAACGGSTSNAVMDPAPDGGGPADDGAAGGDGSPAGDGGSSKYTLDNVCDLTAPTICAARKPCCEQTAGFDEAACEAQAKTDCAVDVAAAKAGTEEFHPDDIDTCLAKLPGLLTGCHLTFAQLQDIADALKGCHTFTGQKAIGQPCTRDNECAQTDKDDTFISCSGDTHTCSSITFLDQGADCSFADGIAATCKKGLYCDIDFAGGSSTGTCKPATALGDPCDGTKAVNLQCGLGNYCPQDAGVCTVGRNGGAACTNDLQCQAIKCQGPDGGMTCADPGVLVKPEECKGP